MKTNKSTQPMIQTSAFNREGSGYAVTGLSFKNWSPCDEHKYEAFEGWDG